MLYSRLQPLPNLTYTPHTHLTLINTNLAYTPQIRRTSIDTYLLKDIPPKTMGLIKTAMMSGAAMYGVNQLAKTAQNRNNNPPPPRREYNDRDYESYYSRPLEYRERDPRDRSNGQPEDMRERRFDASPRRRLYLDEQHPSDYGYDPYYMPAQYDNRPHSQEYASSVRPASAPRQYYVGQRQGQGFVEPEELIDDSREPQGSTRANMVNVLAQGVMGMDSSLGGGKKGKKAKDSKGDLLGSLMSK